MKLECLDNCDDTLFRPTTDHYGLSDLIEKLDIKRLYVFSKGSGWNRYGFKGPFWESAFYDATDYDATLKFENGNLPYNSACSTYCYDFDKAPEYFDKGVKNYREQYEHDFPVSEEDLDLLEDNEEEMG